MKNRMAYGALALIGVSAAIVGIAAAQRSQREMQSEDVPPIFRARGSVAPSAGRGPEMPFGRVSLRGNEEASVVFSKVYKKKIDKAKITGPILLSVDHLSDAPERFLEIKGAELVGPGAAIVGYSNISSPKRYVRLTFKPFKTNVPHLLMFDLVASPEVNKPNYYFEGSGVSFQGKASPDGHLGFVVVPTDSSPIVLTVSCATTNWVFHGVEVSMLND